VASGNFLNASVSGNKQAAFHYRNRVNRCDNNVCMNHAPYIMHHAWHHVPTVYQKNMLPAGYGLAIN
jgi:hypothetical protein